MTRAMDELAINNFREYLKIESVHPKPDYESCVRFLKQLGEELSLKSQVVHLDKDHPVLILTLEGEAPELPSILLNSHMDVVPVFKEEWKYDPFGAVMDANDDIFARGAQDMKSVTIAEIEAIRRLKKKGIKLKRTIHLSVLPDEEMGSKYGMAKFVKTEAFKKLNIGFDLDEGVPSYHNDIFIFQNERCHWRIFIHCPGTTGHGSLFLPNTPGEKLRIVIDKFMEFREKEASKVKLDDLGSHGGITTINLTTIEGGVQNNVVPDEFIVGFDMRIAAEEDHEKMEKWVQDVCSSAGEGVYAEYEMKDSKAPELSTYPFSQALEDVLTELKLKYKMYSCSAATDARFARMVGVPALGMSPFLNTSWRYHGHNEYMNKNVFLQGISRYEKIIQALANV